MLTDLLEIHEIFSSIQTEGPFMSRPAIFIRLAGCNLSCGFCDTDHTSNAVKMTIEEVMKQVCFLSEMTEGSLKFVVITGGEPFLQDMEGLVHALAKKGYKIQIETNGTLGPRKFPWGKVDIVCSPKKNAPVHWRIVTHAKAFKYVVRANEPVVEHSWSEDKIYIQPMDEHDPEKNKANNLWAVAMCIAKGWRLSVQVHKFLGIP